MIELDCPNCGHHLRIHDGYAGQTGKCRHCRAPIQVPEAPKPETPQQGAGEFAPTPVDRPGLSALDAVDDWKPPPVPEAPAKEFKKLGCLYWFLAIFFSPCALIWGILLPKGHPQRKIAILVPAVLMGIVAILALIAGVLFMSSLALIGQGLSELGPEVTF